MVETAQSVVVTAQSVVVTAQSVVVTAQSVVVTARSVVVTAQRGLSNCAAAHARSLEGTLHVTQFRNARKHVTRLYIFLIFTRDSKKL